MARGCVVVASNIGGLPEVVKDGEVGLLHEVNSANDIVYKINLLMSDSNLLYKYSIAAVKYVEKYSFERYSQLFNDLYKKL